MRLTPRTWVRECPGTSAHPRRLPMACAVGWMTTRVRLGRCSRIRRSAHGGTACARTAPSGIRRGSAELAVAGAGGRPCEHAVQVPAVFVHEPRCASVHQQNGGHPAACRSWYAQCTVCSRPWTLIGTVLGMVVKRLLLCNGRCPGWSAQKTVEFRSCSACGRCPVPGQGCCTRRCNDYGPGNAWFD